MIVRRLVAVLLALGLAACSDDKPAQPDDSTATPVNKPGVVTSTVSPAPIAFFPDVTVDKSDPNWKGQLPCGLALWTGSKTCGVAIRIR